MSIIHEGYISVGRIVGVFGIRGWMKVLVYSGMPDRFQKIKTVYLEGRSGLERKALDGQQTRNQSVVIKLEGCEDREIARTLIGKEIFLPEQEKIELPADHFFVHDLIGLEVFDTGGIRVGKVTEVLPSGGGDILVIRDGEKEILLPAVAEFVKTVEVENGRIVIRMWDEM